MKKHRSIQSIAHLAFTAKHNNFPRFFLLLHFSHVYVFLPHKSLDWQHISDYDCFSSHFSSGVYSLELLFVYVFNLNFAEGEERGVLCFQRIFLFTIPWRVFPELLTIKHLQCAMSCGCGKLGGWDFPIMLFFGVSSLN